jgi:hypothetical protein
MGRDVQNDSGGLTPESIDRLSLEQALVDADVALARTRDLALRLVEAREQLAEERRKSLQLADALTETKALYDAILGNRAYRLASRAWALRRAIGV